MSFSSTHQSHSASDAEEREQNEVLAGLAASSRTLHPMVKRRILPQLPGQPAEVKLGWVQFPASRGHSFSLGLFSDKRHFSQIALVDGHGRVFMGEHPNADTFDRTPVFRFVPDSVLPQDVDRSPHVPIQGGVNERIVHEQQEEKKAREEEISFDSAKALHGAIIGHDDFDRPLWLAAWKSKAKRYDILEARAQLPEELRTNLEYRDAMAIAFFGVYLLPSLSGFLVGYGAGNIFRRLRQEAPIGAIRRSVADTLRAEQYGMRVSGLEEHFSYLMQESGALDELPGLEAVHGAEPMHLFTSSYSKSFFLSWGNGMEYRSALKALQIEGNLNRFAQVSAILERNRRLGRGVIEDEANSLQVARIDMNLLENPALIALPTKRMEQPLSLPRVDSGLEVADYPEYALNMAVETAATAVKQGAQGIGQVARGSEWVYRQTMSELIRQLRLPFRFDAEFRSNLKSGRVAIGFTTAGMAMMPQTRYDEASAGRVGLNRDERAAMSAEYNMRVGIMLAALGFGADSSVKEVTLQIDSIGLEEAVEEQDSAIAQMLTDALSAFEQARTGHGLGATGAKGDPKDGDIHGNPANAGMPPSQRPQGAPLSSLDADGFADFDDEDDEDIDDTEGFDGASDQDSASEENAAAGAADGAAGNNALNQTSALAGSQAGSESGAGSNATSQNSGPFDGHPAQGGQNTNDGAASASSNLEGNDLQEAFNAVMQGVDLPEMDLESGNGGKDDADSGNADGEDMPDGEDAQSDQDSDDDSFNPADPMSVLRTNPTVRRMLMVTFTRDEFLSLLSTLGLTSPVDTYRHFKATMKLSATGGLQPIDARSGWRDSAFAPLGAQEEPELSDKTFSPQVAQVLGAHDSLDLSIQREDLLQRAVAYFNELSRTESLTPVESAQQGMELVKRLSDPELTQKAGIATGALIDGLPTPDITFELSKNLNTERIRARDELFKGQTAQAIEIAEQAVERYDAIFNSTPGIPRYFNSYAERVVYNKLFAMPGEKTVLIPDNLFYAHMELADILAQISGPQESIKHLNKMVAYAPAYPLTHLRLSVQLARIEDWDSARAATLNALRVALDRDDAAFAYYRYAYSAWMRDEFDLAVAGYVMSDAIRPGAIPALQGELTELMARVESQCIDVPRSADEAVELLKEEGVPVWPSTEVTKIVQRAARVAVDEGLFVPARTLALASARLDDSSEMGLDMVQSQFLRSLNA